MIFAPRDRAASFGNPIEGGKDVQIPKEQILDLLRSRGENDKASQAEGELPDQVDTDQHAGLLEKFGLNPGDLISQLGGGALGGKLGL